MLRVSFRPLPESTRSSTASGATPWMLLPRHQGSLPGARRCRSHQPGLRRVKVEGRHPSRPHRLSGEERQSVLELLATGASISSLARKFDTSRQTIMRVRDGVPAGRG